MSEKINTQIDMVNKPPHYNRDGAMECIEEMEMVFGAEQTSIFCLLNCWKYRYRSGLKGDPEEDMKKSYWYLRKYKELRDKSNIEFFKNITIPNINYTSPITPNPSNPYNDINRPIVTCSGDNNIK